MNDRSARWKARGKAGLAVSALFLAAHAQAAQLEPPKTVGASSEVEETIACIRF